MEALRRVVYAFYSRDFSFARFLKRFPQFRDDVVHVLTGNVYRRPVDDLIEALDRELPSRGNVYRRPVDDLIEALDRELPSRGYRPLSLPGEDL
jgi:hypothetical protein